MEYKLIRSNRKTISIEIVSGGTVLVRAPLNAKKEAVERFVQKYEKWAEERIERVLEREKNHPEPDEEKQKQLRQEAREKIVPLVEKYAQEMGVVHSGIKITSAKKRFGSCSDKNSLCFSWRLMLYPAEAIEYVVVHELAHIKHKDHSREFYAFVERFMPDYKERQNLLRK